MRFGGNYFNYSSDNKLTKLLNSLLFKRMFLFCLWDGAGPLLPSPLATPLQGR